MSATTIAKRTTAPRTAETVARQLARLREKSGTLTADRAVLESKIATLTEAINETQFEAFMTDADDGSLATRLVDLKHQREEALGKRHHIDSLTDLAVVEIAKLEGEHAVLAAVEQAAAQRDSDAILLQAADELDKLMTTGTVGALVQEFNARITERWRSSGRSDRPLDLNCEVTAHYLAPGRTARVKCTTYRAVAELFGARDSRV